MYLKHLAPNSNNCYVLYSDAIIVTPKICFYFISCQKSIPKDAKLHVNEKGLSETEIIKTKRPL